jgi:hypothetical protein
MFTTKNVFKSLTPSPRPWWDLRGSSSRQAWYEPSRYVSNGGSSTPWGLIAAGGAAVAGLIGGVFAYRHTNNGHTPGRSYEDWSTEQLYERAKAKEIPGRSTMNKQELIEALREA